MSVDEVFLWLGVVAGGLVSLGVIWTKGVRPLWRFLRRVEAVHELIIDELPAFMRDTREWQAAKDPVLKQLQPNSGSSMFDRVMRTEELLQDHVSNKAIHAPTYSPMMRPPAVESRGDRGQKD
ncbi:hypothetical protein [Streptomyces sp. NBC_00525]|uniref:hypothetical protein n=1 Tax=Streptomyces sp. NBC_00525 TaxID=2903660 RepID=UPI002E812448|nr:hypothetical protein [Streptomyces sp. NBC_00525]WUC97408.1 hypothetical protein OG710_29005 [Streptomyces sp. NBC_00525]